VLPSGECQRVEAIIWEVETTDAIHDGNGWSGNYSWVRRERVKIDDGLTDRQLITKLREVAGLTGSRAVTERYGEGYMWKHCGAAILTFAHPRY
jgi:hypothetical protein